MEIKNNISVNLNFLRKQKRISQKDFALIIGKKTSVVSSYETGNATPPIDIIKIITNYFDVTIDEFINEDLSKRVLEDEYGTTKLTPEEILKANEYANEHPNMFKINRRSTINDFIGDDENKILKENIKLKNELLSAKNEIIKLKDEILRLVLLNQK